MRLVGGVPVIYLENHVVAHGCPGIEVVDFGQQPMFETLEDQFKLQLDWGRRFFEAQAAGAEPAQALGIIAGSPVMYLEQLVYLANGTPIELSDVWLRGDHFRLSATVKRNRGGQRRRSSLELYRTAFPMGQKERKGQTGGGCRRSGPFSSYRLRLKQPGCLNRL